MRRYEECKESRFDLVSEQVCCILDALDKPALEEINRQLVKLDIDLDYCCEHPDVLCSILKIACGRSYVDVIRSITA